MAVFFLAAYLVSILIRPMDWWEPLLGYELVTVGAVLILLIGFPQLLARFPVLWKRVPQLKAAIGFLLAISVSLLARAWFGGALDVFVTFGKVIIFYFLIILLVKTVDDLNLLIWAFLMCALWLAVHAIMQHHLGYGFGGQEPLFRKIDPTKGTNVYQAMAYGTFNDPNDLSAALVVAIPLFITQFYRKNFLLKAVSFIGIPLVAYGIYCTNSRGGVVAFGGMLLTFIMARLKGVSRYLVIVLAVVGVTVVAPSRFVSSSTEGHDRAILWGQGLDMFKSNPIFGGGYGNFANTSEGHHVAHNSYIHTLAETGLLGYIPFFLIIYLTIVQLRRLLALKNLIPKSDFVLLTGLYAGLTGYLTGVYFISRQYQHILYVFLGLAVSGVYVISERNGLRDQIFGAARKDLQSGLVSSLGSIVAIWIVIRLANLVS